MKRATLSAKREVHICRSAKRDDHQVARPRRAHSCERSELHAKRATKMCERSEQIFFVIPVRIVRSPAFWSLLKFLRAPVAQVIVHPTSKQEVQGSIPEPGYQWKFSGGSEPSLNCRSHHKEVSDLQGKEAPCRGANYLGVSGWFWEICLYSFWKTLKTRKTEGV